jgi:hypothetical protein
MGICFKSEAYSRAITWETIGTSLQALGNGNQVPALVRHFYNLPVFSILSGHRLLPSRMSCTSISSCIRFPAISRRLPRAFHPLYTAWLIVGVVMRDVSVHGTMGSMEHVMSGLGSTIRGFVRIAELASHKTISVALKETRRRFSVWGRPAL